MQPEDTAPADRAVPHSKAAILLFCLSIGSFALSLLKVAVGLLSPADHAAARLCPGGASWSPTPECAASAHGFWGPVDSVHTFCEVSYGSSSLVAPAGQRREPGGKRYYTTLVSPGGCRPDLPA